MKFDLLPQTNVVWGGFEAKQLSCVDTVMLICNITQLVVTLLLTPITSNETHIHLLPPL